MVGEREQFSRVKAVWRGKAGNKYSIYCQAWSGPETQHVDNANFALLAGQWFVCQLGMAPAIRKS
jgi:hypothetical protein